MRPLKIQPSLAEQVYDVIVEQICDGELPAGAHLVQEDLAASLGVSRQPVQQALALLKADGMVREIGRRGLQVVALDLDAMVHHYEIRAALDGLAARLSAARTSADPDLAKELAGTGRYIIRRGEVARDEGHVHDQVREDEAFHKLFYEYSGNPLMSQTAETHWRFLRRAMADVMRYAELPRGIWTQHAEILDAVVAGDAVLAERLAVDHALGAAGLLHDARAGATAEEDAE